MRMPWRGSAGALVTAAALAVFGSIGVTSASAAPPGPGQLVINEVESNGGTPGDWVELLNTGSSPADIGGYVVRDNDDTHSFVIPAGTAIAAGGFYVADVDTVATVGGSATFGLGSADSARLFAPDGTTLLDSYSWTAHAATTYGRCPDGTGAFATTASSTRGAANTCGTTPPAGGALKINEVESNGGTPGDWVELVNTGSAPADIGGYVVKDNDDSHVFTIPAGTTIAAGGHYVADVEPVFGLGSADSARLFAPDGTTLLDSYSWTEHATTTYGRCPDGTGSFTTTNASTRGAVNACPGDPAPWPGGASVSTVDVPGFFGTNLSGLAYQPSGTGARGTLWAVKNGPGTLYRLRYDGTNWAADTTGGWAAGKALHYPGGTGDPDAEGVTLVNGDPANGVYVSTERDNADNGVSRPAVLRFDASATGTSLNATDDWNLTADLPGLGANLGLEAIQWMPDSFLVAHGFKDEITNAPYDPATYPGHGSGLFFVGVEQNGTIYAYALKSDDTYTRVATIASGFPAVMDLEFEPESGHLWAVCDDTCNGRTSTLDIAQSGANAGRFVVTGTYERPGGMPNINNEGFAIAPRAECVGGLKPVFWSDDNGTDGHALREGTLDCTPQSVQTITFAQPAAMTFGDGPQALSASASSGLPVRFSATGPCTVSGNQLSATGAGTCTVTASQAGTGDVAPAPDVARTVTIAKAPTALVQKPVSLVRSVLDRRITFQATLTARGEPVSGQPVSFSLRGGVAGCSATTNARGVATCTSSPKLLAVVIVLAGQSTATYAGSANDAGSSNTRAISVL
jgi:hypothetical protein